MKEESLEIIKARGREQECAYMSLVHCFRSNWLDPNILQPERGVVATVHQDELSLETITNSVINKLPSDYLCGFQDIPQWRTLDNSYLWKANIYYKLKFFWCLFIHQSLLNVSSSWLNIQHQSSKCLDLQSRRAHFQNVDLIRK